MTRRLLQALQRGGVAAQLSRDRWGIWRGHDRRRLMVGVLPGTEIDVLRLRSCLAPLGEGNPPQLVWSGPVEEKSHAPHSTAILQSAAPVLKAPLLQNIITGCADRGLRTMIRETAFDYQQDHASANEEHASLGMNWDGLALGGRIQGGRPFEIDRHLQKATVARQRLRALHQHFTHGEIEFLRRLIIFEESRAKLAKRYETRPVLIERRAVATIRTLAELYHLQTSSG